MTVAKFDAAMAVFAAGLVLMAGLAVLPCHRVPVATNVVHRHDGGRWYRAKIVQQIRSGADSPRLAVLGAHQAAGADGGGHWRDRGGVGAAGSGQGTCPAL
jgi:hypothetical protein